VTTWGELKAEKYANRPEALASIEAMNSDLEVLYRKRQATHDDQQAPKLTAIESVALEALDEGHGECASQAIQDERALKADNERLRAILKGFEYDADRGRLCSSCRSNVGYGHGAECAWFNPDGTVK
jgi:hypothetical protein